MTGSELLKQAEKYLGDKGNTFWKAYGYDHAVAWCCIWVWYVFKKAKCCELFYDCGKVQNVANADAWLRRNAEWVKIKDAQPGDIVIFTWDSKGGNNTRVGHRDHIGIVVKAENSTTLKTIEGNVGSNNSAKSKVDYRTRKAKLIYAVYHLKYDAPKPKPAKDITKLVKDTLSGKYGTGADRKKALGSDYNSVQKEVNRIVMLTNKTLLGEYGNGSERKKALGKDYDLVQWNINRIYKQKESEKK